jgi:hypothetical protein
LAPLQRDKASIAHIPDAPLVLKRARELVFVNREKGPAEFRSSVSAAPR